MTTQQIPLNRLVPSPLNVRKTESKAATEELKASILAHGLLQNLVVTDAGDGTFEVIAGGRRLHVLHQLVDEEKLEPDHTIPCQIVSDEQAQEMSLAENTVRVAMHPADEFEAFTALADQGSTAAQIAERFGATEKHVLQRLKLGRVAPELLAEYRAGEITLETLMAFTVTDDRKRQTDLYKGLQGWQRDSAYHIRHALTERMTDADDKLAKFVGLDAYEAAGGRTRADLFGEDVYLEDTALLQRLAGEKLEAAAEELRQDGWGWVEMNFERDYSFVGRCGRIQPQPLDVPLELVAELKAAEAEKTRIAEKYDAADQEDQDLVDKLEAEHEAAEERIEQIRKKWELLAAYLPVEKKLAGCYVFIDYSGRVAVEMGLVKPEDKKAVAQAQPEGGEADEMPDDKPGLSQSLVDDLKRYRTQVAQVAIAEDTVIAFDLLVFRVAVKTLGYGYSFDGPDVTFSDQHLKPSVAPDTVAAERLEAIRNSLSLDWLKQKSEPAQFEEFRFLRDWDKHRILAYCTALTLRPKLAPAEGRQKSAYDLALTLTGASVADYWRPTAANFLSRIKREQLLDIGREVLVQGESWAISQRNAKKAALVAELDEAFAKSGNPDTLEAITNWLPEGMVIAEAEPEPAPAKTKKAKNAA